MKYLVLLLIVWVFVVSCSSDGPPKGLLSEDQMVAIIVDIHLTEGFVQSLPIPYDSSRRLYPALEKDVFAKHSVTDSTYLESLQFYLRDAVFMERVYSRAIDSLTVVEKRAEQ